MNNIEIKAGSVSGRFKIEKITASGERVAVADWFSNLIVDGGLDWLGTGNAHDATQYCRAGTGATAPANGQTGLVSQLGSASAIGTIVESTSGGVPVWYQSVTRVYTFAIGAVVGNVAELGTFSAATGGTMFSRALVKDTGGNPTTITILSDEQLVVTYEFRKYPPSADLTGTISIAVDGVPTNFDYVLRAANVDETVANYAYWRTRSSLGSVSSDGFAAMAFETSTLGPATGVPSGDERPSTSAVLSSYVGGTFYRDLTVRFGINRGNFASGVGSIIFANVGGLETKDHGYQISFEPKLPKTNAKTLSLPFRLSWGRYAP